MHSFSEVLNRAPDQKPCPKCGGKGGWEMGVSGDGGEIGGGGWQKCDRCKGTGYVEIKHKQRHA